MTYNDVMKTLQIGRAYPITGPLLRTKKDIYGNRYDFVPEYVQVMGPRTLRVLGRDKHEAWGRVDYNPKSVPKWLKNAVKNLA